MAHDYSADLASGKVDTTLIAEESESFAAFERRIDEQLAQLVALWIHTAAPNASRFEAARERFGR